MPNSSQDEEYHELAKKLLDGTITPEEEAKFFNWYNEGQDQPLIISDSNVKNPQQLKEKIWFNIQKDRDKNKKPAGLIRSIISWRAAAAILLFVMGSGVFYLLKNTKEKEGIASKQTTTRPAKAILSPGGNRATLTLANGNVVALDDVQNGKIADEGSADVVILKKGLLSYTPSDNSVPPTNTITYNILSTPRGGQYQVQLPDGSRVWLNAASSLKYPTAFSGNERVVELTGEGYFEVAKNTGMPFKVKVRDMEVAVLGTHFNIMAYDDERFINTTLLEGSVNISTARLSKRIVPGQQARLAPDGKMKIVDVDLEETVAWKNGFFHFNSANMQTVIRQITRWYDVDVVYAGDVDEHFTGTISRGIVADEVLRKLQFTGAFKFQIKNKQVFINK